jgi:hypothetical protein
MAKKHITQLIDDLDGGVLDDGITLNFSLEGRAYEIDVSEENAQKVRDAFAPFIAAGRSTSVAPSRQTSRGRGARSAARTDLADVRSWAAQNGHSVSTRGRVPASVLDAYDAAH